ncbi:MAG: alpha-L-fucosidase [Pirellulaceae bacterium]
MVRSSDIASRFLLALLVALAIFRPVSAQADGPNENNDKMAWWRHDRFGMFIHWGLYAVPAGQWQGQPVSGTGEWIMNNARIPRTDYETLAGKFNPTAFDADAWVRMAGQAGMKYIVVTSKHHDGFCLFDSYGQYDIVNATPYAKDILRPLREACQRHDVKFCTYYSIMDWHHPSQVPSKEVDGRPMWNPTRIDPQQKATYTEYMKQHLRVLVEDLQTHVLWFDGEWPDWWTDEDGQALYRWLVERNPQLIVNNRIGAGRKGMSGFTQDGSFAGDFGTPEQEIPATGVDADWESCMTMNDTWGYSSTDRNWKSSEQLVRNLIDIASKGGNYLLNIGPKADGTFPDASVERLREIGDWMAVNSEAIYGTTAAIFLPEWGRVTCRKNSIYLHVFNWPSNGQLEIPLLERPIRRASLLAKPDVTLATKTTAGKITIEVPREPVTKYATVVVLDWE